MKDLKAKHLMIKELVSVRDTDSIGDLAALLKAHHISGVPVKNEGGIIVGVVALSDMACEIANTTQRTFLSNPIP